MPRTPRPLIAVPDRVTPVASLDTLADRAADLPNGILNCREHRRHDWRPATVRRVGAGFHRRELCTDCHSERWQDLDSRGIVSASGVKYSEGYLNPPGTGRVDQSGQGVYRLELLNRLVDGLTEHPTARREVKRRRPRKAAAS